MLNSKDAIIKNVSKWGWLTALIPIALWFLFSSKDPVLSDSYRGKDVGVILAAMPEQDRKDLDFFFENFSKEASLAMFYSVKSPWRLMLLHKTSTH
jgi:hypothetical protein